MNQITVTELLLLGLILLICLAYLYRWVRKVFDSRRCSDDCCSGGDACLPKPPSEQVVHFDPKSRAGERRD